MERIWKEALAVFFKVLSQHSLEGLRKTTKCLGRCPGQLRLQARRITESATFIDRPPICFIHLSYIFTATRLFWCTDPLLGNDSVYSDRFYATAQ
jgi:hypothetical protein